MSHTDDPISSFLNDLDQLLVKHFGQHFHYNIVDIDHHSVDDHIDPPANYISISLAAWTDEEVADVIYLFK